MKRYLVCVLVLALLLSGCASMEEPPASTQAAPVTQLANPWRSFDTLAEAEEAAGFSFGIPERIDTYSAESFRVMNGQLLEVGYFDGESEILVRKQAGEGQDLSGVYESFDRETVYQTGDSWIITRASEDRTLDLIDSGGYSWSVYAPEKVHTHFLDGILGEAQTWLRAVNEAFNATVREQGGSPRPSELSCFFSCTWAAPEEIDLAEFLRYCPLREQLTDETTEEARAVAAAMGENPFLVTPVWRYPREAVSALLQNYTGITAEALSSWEGVLYLEEYDSFYNCTSDWGPGRFLCTGAEKDGNRITLWGEGNGGIARVLTLQEENGTYRFLSHLDKDA